MTQEILLHLFAFNIDGGAAVLVDNNAIAVLDGLDNFLMAYNLEQRFGT